jgi:hypothetical protein
MGSSLTCHGSDETERGAAMSGTHPIRASLSSYRDAVTDLLAAGERFGDVEDAIDDVPGLTQDEKAALWLFAFSLRDPAEQQLDTRAYLAALQEPG